MSCAEIVASAIGTACARAALAGNPSDGYGGAVLAFTLAERHARVLARQTSHPAIEPAADIVAATLRRFARDYGGPDARALDLQWQTDIPRGVGLGGSSAIVIATLRAVCKLHGVRIEPSDLAVIALAVETEELGIAAGLQDRVAQAHEGVVFMDFDGRSSLRGGHGHYELLDAGALPPLLIAWRPGAAKDSGGVHAPLRERFARGEAAVIAAMSELGELAREARDAALTGDGSTLAHCADRSFEARRRILELDPRDVRMIECARACGAGANYTGSGGAIVAVCADEDQRTHAAATLADLGAEVLLPTIGGI
jgi:galactokinase/mevalonate kinase-like predicted kinase